MGDSESMELLELAAKAAGKRIVWERPYVATGDFAQVAYDAVTEVVWNPLTDDGDALRLAVKLHISLYADDDSYVFGVTKEQRQSETADPESHYGWCECWNTDPMSATRRAIVRAAAEIGKAMP